jgi:sulfide:quinone oxidoreductase
MNLDKTHVLVAGGGVAALEAALALRKMAPDFVTIELLAPEEHFSYRPLSVTVPFDGSEPVRFGLAELAAEIGASVTRGALTGIDAWRHLAHTSTNRDLEYDVLLVACGALPLAAIRGAVTFRGPADVDLVRHVLEEAARGEIRSLAFVVPWGAAWSLPAYELALMAGAHAPTGLALWLVTPEFEPLQLYGPPASAAVRELLSSHGVNLATGAYVERFENGQLRLASGGLMDVDRAIALPRLAGAPIDGIPQTIEGFVPVDDHGRVHGVSDVYAAGDITSFPVKHGGLATQQALAAAETIAANAGAYVEPKPFRPVVQGLLLTGSEPRFLRRELGGSGAAVAEYEPLWWPPAKIVGRHLGPFLAARVAATAAGIEAPDEQALPIEVTLEPEHLARVLVGPLPTDFDEMEGSVEATISSSAAEFVAPEDTLGEVAERMLEHDISAVLVAEYGRMIGILTTHDLMNAFAARANPSEARARQWMTAEPITMPAGSSRVAAARMMHAFGIHHLPLVDRDRAVAVLHLDLEYADAVVPIGLGF